MSARDRTGDDANAFGESTRSTPLSSAGDLVVGTLLWIDAIIMRLLRDVARDIVEGAVAYGLAVHGYPPDYLTTEPEPKSKKNDAADEPWLPEPGFAEFDSMHALIEWAHAQGRKRDRHNRTAILRDPLSRR